MSWKTSSMALSIHHQDKIRAVCGDDPFFFHGARNNPLVIEKRQRALADADPRLAEGAGPQPSGAPVADLSAAPRKAAADGEAEPGASSMVKSDKSADSTEEKFLQLAPFLRAADLPKDRRDLSRAFDARIAQFVSDGDNTALPQIHCFYEVMSETAQHPSLIAATQSMRAVGHPVRVWSYAPAKARFPGSHTGSSCAMPPMSCRRASSSGSSPVPRSDIFPTFSAMPRSTSMAGCGWTPTW